MKFLTIATCAAIGIFGTAFSASDLNVVNLCELTNEDFNEILQGSHSDTAVEISAQTTLPISFFLKGELVNLDGNFGEVEIKQTLYARCVPQGLVLSTDLVDWKPFAEFITGKLSATLSIDEGEPSILVGAEIDHRV